MSDEITLDFIREVINIGIGDAADSLSKLVNTRIDIRAPEVVIMDVADIHDYIHRKSVSVSVYISQDFFGMLNGKTLLFYTKECAISLLNSICGETLQSDSLTESSIATLNEIGNIIMVSYLSGISNMTDSQIRFSLPDVTVDISEMYFQNLIKDMEKLNRAIVVKNEMVIRESSIQGYLFVLLSFSDFNRVIAVLESKIKKH